MAQKSMKFTDVNKRYSEIISDYLANGYIIDSRSMGRSIESEELAKIDLTNGEELIRIALEELHDGSLDGVQLMVYKLEYPGSSKREYGSFATEGSYRKILLVNYERFYNLCAWNRDPQRYFFGTKREEAEQAAEVRRTRESSTTLEKEYGKAFIGITEREVAFSSDEAKEIAIRFLKKRYGESKIFKKHLVQVSKILQHGTETPKWHYCVRYATRPLAIPLR